MEAFAQLTAGGALAVLLVREFSAHSRRTRADTEMRAMREAVSAQQETLAKITIALERLTLILEYMKQDIRGSRRE